MKKLIALFALVLSLSVITGCGSKKSKKVDTQTITIENISTGNGTKENAYSFDLNVGDTVDLTIATDPVDLDVSLELVIKSGDDFVTATEADPKGVNATLLNKNTIRVNATASGEHYMRVFSEKAEVFVKFNNQALVNDTSLDMWVLTSYHNVFKDFTKELDSKTSINWVAAKNEYESMQVVLRGNEAFKVNDVRFSDLVLDDGHKIDSDNLYYKFVEYHLIEEGENTVHMNPNEALRWGAGYYPDPLSNEESMDVKANEAQPLWVTVYVPKGTTPGMYRGVATIVTDQGEIEVSVNAEIHDVTIPDPDEASYDTFIWQRILGMGHRETYGDERPGDSIMEIYGVERYSDEWWSIVSEFADMMKENRLNILHVQVMELLFDGGTTMDENGKITFDWSRFDEYIQYFIDRDIVNGLSTDPIFVGELAFIFKNTNGETHTARVDLYSDEAKNHLEQFITALNSHLQEKGWLEMWNQSIKDEPMSDVELTHYKYVSDMFHELAPNMQVGDAHVNMHFSNFMFDNAGLIVTLIDAHNTYKTDYQLLLKPDQKIYTYTALFPGSTYLNRYIDKPVWTARSIAYYNFNYDVDGYLHWGLMAWYRPITAFAFGDTSSIYPDVDNMSIKDSIRMQSLRDGAEEYELLTILSQTNPKLAKDISGAIAPDAKVGYATDIDFMVGIREALIRAAAGDDSIDFDVKEVKLNKSELSLSIGDSEQLTATVLPSRALNKTVRWGTNNPSVVSVSESGMITALRPGTAIITVRSNEDSIIKATVTVTVDSNGDTLLVRSIGDATIQDGSTNMNTNLGGQPTLLVKSDNPSFRNQFFIKFGLDTIEKGVVSAKIKLYAENIAFGGTRTIDVYKTPITWDQDVITWANAPETMTKIASLVITNNGSNSGWYELDVTDIVNPAEGALSLLFVDNGPVDTNSKITFSSKEAVSNHPMLIVKTGTANAVTSIEIDTTPLTLNPGSMRELVASVLPANAANKRLIWESSDSSVVRVDENGKIYALTEGTATIKVSSLANNTIYKEIAITVVLSGKEIYATDDSSITNGANADKTFGDEASLIIKADQSGYFRKSLIQYDLAGLSGSIEEAVVMIKIKNVGDLVSKTIDVYKVASTWNESSVTWNNTPVNGTKITSFTVTNSTSEIDSWIAIDVTDYINLVDGKISLLLVNDGPFNNQSQVEFYSTEAKSNQPKLIVSGNVEYQKPAINEITLNKASSTLKVGETDGILAQIYPLNADSSKVTWSSSNPEIATVDQNGLITAVSSGSTKIKLMSTASNTVFSELDVHVVNIRQTFYVTDDAFVRDGTNANNNYGSGTNIYMRKDAVNYNHTAIVKYNFTGFSGTINEALVRLNIDSVQVSAQRTVKVSKISNTWNESTITWANMPSSREEIGTFKIYNADGKDYWIEIDVTDFINPGDIEISLLFEVIEATTGNNGFGFKSKESGSDISQLMISGNGTYTAPAITEIGLNKTEVKLEEGLSSQLAVTSMKPYLTDSVELVWTSSDETILTVDQNGLVTTHTNGTAKVRAASQANPEVYAEVQFTVVKDYEGDFTKQFKVLAIGNSFSEDALEHLYGIASDFGYDNIIIGHLVIGGSPIDLHASHAISGAAAYNYNKNSTGTWVKRGSVTMLDGLTDEKWDLITIQQVSGKSGDSSSYQPYMNTLTNFINNNKLSSTAKIAWHMTWAYQTGSTHPDFPGYGSSQELMYNMILNAVRDNVLNHANIDMVIPSGTAMQNLRTSYVGDTLTRDGYHLSLGLGRYTAAMMWFKQITGQSIDDISWRPNGVSETDLIVVKEAVNNAFNNPLQVTQSSHQSINDILSNFVDSHEVLAYTTGVGFWNSTSNNNLETSGDLAKKFLGTNMISKDDLPVGSLIVINRGYQYRNNWYSSPTGPISQGRRSDNITSPVIIIDEAWWGNQNFVAFNLSMLGTPYVADIETDIETAFTIYVPKQ